MLGIAWAVAAEDFVYWTLASFFLLAFCSATHDIAADGFYMRALMPHDQALFVGIRSTAYRLAMIAGSGLLVMLVGRLMKSEFRSGRSLADGNVLGRRAVARVVCVSRAGTSATRER